MAKSPAALLVDENGVPVGVESTRLLVADLPPPVPAGATLVDQSAAGNVAGNTSLVSTYTITNGKYLTIQRFHGGGEFAKEKMQSKVELLEDPNGNLSVLNLIRVAYLPGNFAFSLATKLVGDGTRRVVIRRTRLADGTLEIAGFWTGVEV